MEVTNPVVVIDGVTYEAQPATIRKTVLDTEDAPCMTFWLFTEWPGGGIGVGVQSTEYLRRARLAHTLDDRPAVSQYDRRPSLLAGAAISETLRVVGVSSWEALPGKRVHVLFDKSKGGSIIGSTASGIADADLTRSVVWQSFISNLIEVTA